MAKKFKRLLGGLVAIIGETSWVLFAFFAVAAIVFGVIVSSIQPLQDMFDSTLGELLAGGLIYALVLFVVVLPVLAMRGKRYVARILGVTKKPGLNLLWLPLVAWVAYMATTIVAASLAGLVPGFDVEQPQEIGFHGINQPYEYILAFIALVVLPPLAEELLFRGYLFGRLREKFGFWLTTIVVSIAFGVVHLQWNVGVDTAVLSVFLCYLRERTGSIWASVSLHAIKNGLAYFLLFIAPLLGWQLIE